MTEPPVVGKLPQGYAECVERMQRAAAQWCKEHPFAELRFRTAAFEEEVAREAGRQGEQPAIIAPLSAVIDRWAGNADTRLFLEAIDEASGRQATYLQMKALVAVQHEAKLERASGELPPGDWACTGCDRVTDGFTNADGDAEKPGAGALSVCFYCAALRRVNAAGTGFEPLSTRDVNALPKSVRMQLLSLRSEIGRRIAREKQRS